jgi:VIT1/CCC1 family predicted Fe2+/Mn2+ transporter
LSREIERERTEIERHPEHEIRELAEMYAEKGIDHELALKVAEQVHRDVDNAVRVHAREELGVDPDDLPSATLAAGSSFVSFALGALVPLLPYLLGANSLLPGLGITLLALFISGAVVTQLTNRSWFFGGLRQLLLGGAAAGLTYAVGAAVGANFG